MGMVRLCDLHESEFRANEREGGDAGGFGAQHPPTEIYELEAIAAQEGPFLLGPAAFAANRERGRCGECVYLAKRAGVSVVVERESGFGWREGGKFLGKCPSVAHAWKPSVKCLLGASDDMPPPFARTPERAAGVVGIAFVGADEVQCADSEGSGVAQNVAGGLGARQTDKERDGFGRGCGCFPSEGKGEPVIVACDQSGLTTWAVDHSRVK